MKYTVTATLQAPDNDPVDVPWCTKRSAVEAMVSVGQLLDEEAHQPPDGYSTTLLAITVTPIRENQPPWEN